MEEQLIFLGQNIEAQHFFKVKLLEQQTKKRLNLIEEKDNLITKYDIDYIQIANDFIEYIEKLEDK